MTEIEQLRRALQLARPYVRLAAERLCSDANEERNRAEAADKLKMIDALSAQECENCQGHGWRADVAASICPHCRGTGRVPPGVKDQQNGSQSPLEQKGGPA